MINADGNKGMKRGITSRPNERQRGYKEGFKNAIELFIKNYKETWEEEFEEHYYLDTEYGDFRICPINGKTLGLLVKKYLEEVWNDGNKKYPDEYPKVKIKAKKGKIVIEKC